jgi:hypothetical protein
MTELDKLENWLKEHDVNYARRDRDFKINPITNEQEPYNKHIIIVFDEAWNRKWDAICQYGSYGYENGLLEIYGEICDDVEGWLTAEQVIEKATNKGLMRKGG